MRADLGHVSRLTRDLMKYGPPLDQGCWPYQANSFFQSVGQFHFYIKYNKLRQYHFFGS